MGFFGKIFGKKDELGLDETPLPDESSLDLGGEPTNPELPAHLTEPAPEMPGAPRTPGTISSRDLELINSKLDTIKAILGSVDQRIANLEKIAGVEQKKMPW
ncbi:hypothetical protein GOV03_02510 [Candidatus Woesearchaeota archaeon]|nr:hypothetical protein [Candidatus Woesearchaeota archaeon]